MQVLRNVVSRISVMAHLTYTIQLSVTRTVATTLSCKNFFLAPAVSALLEQKVFTGQNGSKCSCGASGALTAA